MSSRFPFTWRIHSCFLWIRNQAQEKDLQVMKSFYSRRAARIQEKADRECDRMEYDGSMMFDEYPDNL